MPISTEMNKGMAYITFAKDGKRFLFVKIGVTYVRIKDGGIEYLNGRYHVLLGDVRKHSVGVDVKGDLKLHQIEYLIKLLVRLINYWIILSINKQLV